MGPTQIVVNQEQLPITRSYPVKTDDLLPPLRVSWTADGAVEDDLAILNEIQFTIDEASQEKKSVKQVTVSVADSDDLVAKTVSTTDIHVGGFMI